METKDIVTVGLSAAAFIVSLLSFYFSQIHKPSGAVLILLERTFSPATFVFIPNSSPYSPAERRLNTPQMRHLTYTLSNTGKQTLYVKNVELLQGPNARGNLKSHKPFVIIPSSEVEPFLLSPGSIQPIRIDHETDFDLRSDYPSDEYCYQLVSLEIVSADGNRYQICHDVTKLASSGPDLHHPLWDGTPLGAPIRNAGYF